MKNNTKKERNQKNNKIQASSKWSLWIRLGIWISVIYLLYFFIFFSFIAQRTNFNIVLTFLALFPGAYILNFIAYSFLYLICFIIINTAFYFLIGALIGLLISKIRSKRRNK